MKRWDIAIVSSGPASITTKLEIQPFESAQGPWVRCDDVSQLLADYEATRAINVRLQGEVDRLTVKELKLGVALHAVIEVVQKDSPQWLLADQLIRMMEAPGSAQQVPCECPEVCKVCGGRARACAVLGHRSQAERHVRWHECPGSVQQAPQPGMPADGTRDGGGVWKGGYWHPVVPHEHRWSKRHDCGDPKCAATGNVMCLEPNCYARPGADPHE